MEIRKDITLKEHEEFVKRDLDDIITPGTLCYRGVPFADLNKDQLIMLIYLMTIEMDKIQSKLNNLKG